MQVFNSMPEPWARLSSGAVPVALSVPFFFFGYPLFGLGLVAGAVICVLLHWAARVDERPFWVHIVGREVAYSKTEQTEEERLTEEVLRLKLRVAELLALQEHHLQGPHDTSFKAKLDGASQPS
jgi:hypothetical protein